MNVAMVHSGWHDVHMMYLPWLPIGLVSIGTVLEQDGHRVRILDAIALRWNDDKVMGWIKAIDPDIVGFSVFTLNFLPTIDLARRIKAWNPNARIVMGHFFPTVEATNIIKKYGDVVDFCVRGDGERTMLLLCKCIEKGELGNLTEIKGLTYRNADHKIVSTPDAPLEMNLDNIPIINRKLVETNDVWSANGYRLARARVTTMNTSRGCPHRCSYCACSTMARNTWRPRSPEKIVEELKIIAGEGYTNVNFVDDNFTLKPSRVETICDLMRKEGIDIYWNAEGRVDRASVGMFKKMHDAGCTSIWLGFESASQRVLDSVQKQSNVSQFLPAIKNVRRGGIEFIVGLFLIASPTETLAEIRQTLDFALKADIDLPFFNLTDIHSGIAIWDDAVTRGVFKPDDVVNVRCNGTIRQVERWETSEKLMYLTRPVTEQEAITRLLKEANDKMFSTSRARILLNEGVRLARSKYARWMAYEFLVHLPGVLRAFHSFRKARPMGFGRCESEELYKKGK